MRYLILSDLHANWEALTAVLADAKQQYDSVLCCGDVVGYGADPNKMTEYGKLAGPALQAAGAKFLARGIAAMAYEKGIKDRVVVIEFESVDKAIAAHDSPGYQAALKALDGGAQRDIRIVEGLS